MLTESLDTQGKAAPEGHPAMTAAMGPGETKAHRVPPALAAFPAHPGPKDPRGRRVSRMHCLKRTVTDTGVKPESRGWSASRGLPAAPGLWGRWAQLALQEDRDHLDPRDPKDSLATVDLVFMEERVRRAT